MDDSKLEPQPEEGDINNNSETLDRAMLVSMHTLFTARRTHQEPRALPPHTVIWPPEPALAARPVRGSQQVYRTALPVPAALEPAGACPDKPAKVSPQPAPPGAHTNLWDSLASPVLHASWPTPPS
eukprot:scaffold111524_cov61-Phaeocystis_antarctica.AAC.2